MLFFIVKHGNIVESDDAVNGDRLYDLVAVVVHCGATPNRGHYITVVKSNSFWLLFDDDIVDVSPATCDIFYATCDDSMDFDIGKSNSLGGQLCGRKKRIMKHKIYISMLLGKYIKDLRDIISNGEIGSDL